MRKLSLTKLDDSIPMHFKMQWDKKKHQDLEALQVLASVQEKSNAMEHCWISEQDNLSACKTSWESTANPCEDTSWDEEDLPHPNSRKVPGSTQGRKRQAQSSSWEIFNMTH